MADDISQILGMKGTQGTGGKQSGRDSEGQGRGAAFRFRKASLYSFMVFLSLSALFAVASVLSGKIGEFEIKVMITTLAIAVASICSLCCSACSDRLGRLWPGIGGISLAVVSAAMLIAGVWAEMHADEYWKTTAILGVLTIACAHASALLAVRLHACHSWIQIGAVVNIFVLAGVISGMIAGEIDDESAFKTVAVLAILVALETLAIPILGRTTKPASGEVRETLSLTKQEDGLYLDNHGRLYQVMKISDEQGNGTRP